jgi:CRISPR-associated protein Cas2
MRKQWYVLAYDVRDPKRLRKVHYYLSKEAFSLQNSVFLVHVDQSGLKTLLDEVKSRVVNHIDDIRIYPIIHPEDLWAAGKQAAAISGLYSGRRSANKPVESVNLFKALLDRFL